MIRIGSHLSGRYLIDGASDQPKFFCARDTHKQDISVLVGVIGPADVAEFERRFRAVVTQIAQLKNDCVMGPCDAGVTRDGHCFVILPRVEGLTVRSALRDRRILPERAARLVKAIGNILTAAHNLSIYHGNLQPEDIILRDADTERESAVITKFGLAELQSLAVTDAGQDPAATKDFDAFIAIAHAVVAGESAIFDAKHLAKLPEPVAHVFEKVLPGNRSTKSLRPDEFANELAKALETAREKQGVPSGDETGRLEMASVLFMDVVGYSILPMERQSGVLKALKKIVLSTEQFKKSQAQKELVPIPTGDGMALVFFTNPTAPIHCALQVAREMKNRSDINLRMGVHHGPVYRVADINANINVAGGGINMAQRVMDCGDSGHILLSASVADFLSNLSDWPKYMKDLGEHTVKHGVKVRLYSLCTGEVGCDTVPERLRALTGTVPENVPPPLLPQTSHTRRWVYMAAGSVVTVGLLVLVALEGPSWSWFTSSAMHPDRPSVSVASQRTPQPGLAATQPSLPAAGKAARSVQVSPRGERVEIRPLTQVGSRQPVAGIPEKVSEAQPGASGNAPVQNTASSAAPAPVTASAAEPPRMSDAQSAAVAELRQRISLLRARAGAAKTVLTRVKQEQQRVGLNLRSDALVAEQQVDDLLKEADAASKAGDPAAMKTSADLAERQIERLESFVGR